MAVIFINKLEYSMDGTVFNEINFQSGSGEFSEYTDQSKQGVLRTINLGWRNVYSAGMVPWRVLHNQLCGAVVVRITATSGYLRTIETAGILPVVSRVEEVAVSPGGFSGETWTMVLELPVRP